MVNLDDILSQIKTYKSNFNASLIKQGHDFCILAHKGQFRKSGHPYHIHPISVAFELAKLKLDEEAIVAGFLHDVIEDTKYDKKYIAEKFSNDIAEIVDGVTKLKQVNTNIDEIKQVENLRKMFLHVSKDIRVLLVKICDRLDNMRSVEHHANHQKIRQIAKETIEIHAPLAERLGLVGISDELQDVCFKILNPEARLLIIDTIQKIKKTHIANIIEFISRKLEMLLFEYGIDAQVVGREKTPYSIWRKMQTQNINIQDLTDITGFRIITNDVASCYAVLGILHTQYKAIPYKFFDYISTPKPNNYQSIHTAVIDKHGNKIEIQIRTQKMHEEAVFGVAAHWSYKQNVDYQPNKKYGYFIKELNSIFQNNKNASEILNQTRNEIFFERIFVFTSRSDLVELPFGATALDFAFHIHTQIGLKAEYAVINGKNSNINTVLKNGDIVYIHTGEKQSHDTQEIASILTTSKAKNILRKVDKNIQKEEKLKYIQELMDAHSQTLGISSKEVLDVLIKKLKYQDTKILFRDILLNKINVKEEIEKLNNSDINLINATQHTRTELLTYSCQFCCKTTDVVARWSNFIENIGIIKHSNKECPYAKNNTLL